MNPTEGELGINNFEEFDRKGQYKELLEYSRNKQGVEARYWELLSLMWLGKKVELKIKIQEYEHEFTEDCWKSRYLHVRGLYHWGHESYKSQQYYDEAFEIAKKMGYEQGIVDYYIYTAHITNDPEKQKKLVDQAHRYVKESDYKNGLFWILDFRAWQKIRNGEFEQAEDYFRQAHDLCTANEDDFTKSLLLNSEGTYYRIRSDYNKSLAKNELAYKLALKTENGWGIANSLANIATVYKIRGELDKALECLRLQFDQEVKMNIARVARVMMSIGEIHEERGELDKALEMYKTALKTVKEEGEASLNAYAGCKLLIGIVHQKQGKDDNALKAFEESYNILADMNDPFFLAEPLFNLISFHSLKERRKALKYLRELEILTTDRKGEGIISLFKFAKAKYLKSSNRLRDMMQAQVCFEELIQQNEEMGLSTLEFIPHLIELLTIEYESSKDEEVHFEIKSQLTNLIEKAEKEHRYPAKIQALIIQSQMLQLEGDFLKSDEIIDQAIRLAEDHRLQFLKHQAEKIKIEMNDRIISMQNLLRKNVNFTERVKQTRLFSYIKQAQDLAKTGK